MMKLYQKNGKAIINENNSGEFPPISADFPRPAEAKQIIWQNPLENKHFRFVSCLHPQKIPSL